MKALIWAVLCLLFFPWVVQSAEFYRWTDKDGNVHLTNEPPADSGKKVETFHFDKSPVPVKPEAQTSGEVQGSSTGGTSVETETQQENDQELEKKEAEYERLKKDEADFRRNYNNSYGSKQQREYWRERLQEVDSQKQKLDSGETTGTSSPDTSTDHTAE